MRVFQQFTMVLLLAGAPGGLAAQGAKKAGASAAPAAIFQGIYTGTLGDQRIVLEIGAAGKDRDKSLWADYVEKLPIEGRYFYRRHGVGILLEGEPLGDGSVRLKEYGERKLSGAEWKISFSQGRATGFFCKCDASHPPASGELKIALTRISRAFDPRLVWQEDFDDMPDLAYYDLLLDFPEKIGPEVRVNDEIAYVERSDKRLGAWGFRLTRFPDQAVMKKINDLMDSHFYYYRLKGAQVAQGDDFGGGEVSRGDEVKFLSRDFLSVLDWSAVWLSGALHPDNSVRVDVYNMRTGEAFDFTQFFLPPEELAAREEKSDGEDEPAETDPLQRALGELYLKFDTRDDMKSCDEDLIRSGPLIDPYFTSKGMALLSGHVRECGDAVIVPYKEILPLIRKDSPFRPAVEKMMVQ